ncbi:hypothetical protein BJX63DRAFT_431049 [Aspergillus granulosus]|uniref:Uncharacterized protein n=1 Tax=Aspergillus granulosus TaxID=176169 RepID=A0ABR4HHM4_9EURO
MDFLQTTMDAPRSSSLEHSFSSDASRSEHPLAQLAKEVKQQQPFTTDMRLRELLERRRQELVEDQTRDQFLVFTSVPPAQASELSDNRSRTSKYCRFTYNTATKILIAKVMPLSAAHEMTAGNVRDVMARERFAMDLDRELADLGSLTASIGDWTKEANCSWGPRPCGERPSLSFVVEIGFSESMPHLALDARGWIETLSSSVNLVVTIAIHCDRPEIILQQWELAPRRSNVVTRSSSNLAHCTAFIKISRTKGTISITGEPDMNGNTTKITQMDLPFDKLLNRPPRPPLERDFIIPAQTLREMAEDVWKVQKFHKLSSRWV